MPTFLIKPLLIGGIFFSVAVGFYVQSHKIDRLQAELTLRDVQHQQLETANRTLKQQIVAEQQAVENQQKITAEMEAKTNAKRETLRTLFKREPCGNAHLPVAVIEQLQSPSR